MVQAGNNAAHRQEPRHGAIPEAMRDLQPLPPEPFLQGPVVVVSPNDAVDLAKPIDCKGDTPSLTSGVVRSTAASSAVSAEGAVPLI